MVHVTILVLLALATVPLAPAVDAGYLAQGGVLYRLDAGQQTAKALATPDRVPVVFGIDSQAPRVLVGLGQRDVPANSCALPGTDLAWLDADGHLLQRLTTGQNVLTAAARPGSPTVAAALRNGTLYLTDGETMRHVAQDAWQPAWSPDGAQLAYSAMPPDPAVGDPRLGLRLYDTRSGKARVLTRGEADVRPIWTPDGKAILFLNAGRTGVASVYEIPAAGGPPRQLTNVGLARVGEGFVPVPGQDAVWQGDTLIYTVRDDRLTETWSLRREEAGKAHAAKLGSGARAVRCAGGVVSLAPEPGGGLRTVALAEVPR